MLVVNGSFPGPVIQVHKGDTAYVNVHNEGNYGVTIHWYINSFLSLHMSQSHTQNTHPQDTDEYIYTVAYGFEQNFFQFQIQKNYAIKIYTPIYQ